MFKIPWLWDVALKGHTVAQTAERWAQSVLDWAAYRAIASSMSAEGVDPGFDTCGDGCGAVAILSTSTRGFLYPENT
jgi:hypothetical protein